ncbi:DUF192 domain-containing protein [Altererythrobacter sp. GH1-8]|uniref:DUF192 domain-containing protein n=1 Tax=Altererythrobacter sp. GH1-8 TaxID=3349333 RepID=UPI00374CE760
MVRWAWLVIAFALAACSASDAGTPDAQSSTKPDTSTAQNAAARPAVHPVSGLELINVTVDTGEERIGFLTELADTPEAQSRGLMFRTELDDFAAMLFPSASPQIRSFWMKNTPIPLDIVFIGTDNRIINIAAMTTPYSLESVRSEGLAIAVFEIRGGRAAQLGIEAGDLVTWELPE